MKWKDTGGGDFEQPPLGSHRARCIGLIDLGTQPKSYQGKPSAPKRECVVRWELPDELMSTGLPFICSKFYTQSLAETSNLYADLVNWRGREFTAEELAGFDAKSILDKVCMVSITAKVSNGKTKHNITGIMGGPRGMAKDMPPRVNDLLYFSLEPDEFNRQTFDSLSDWYKGKIMVSPEWAALNGTAAHTPDLGSGPIDPLDEPPPF